MTALIPAMLINLAMVMPAAPLPDDSKPTGVCGDVFTAQEEVITAQDGLVAKLRLQVAEQNIVIESLNSIIKSQDRTVAEMAAELERQAGYAKAAATRGRWERFFAGMQYGAVGFGLGVVADRAVWGE